MNIDLAPIHSVDDSINGCWLGTLLSINSNEPPHTAIRAVGESHVPVERHLEGRVRAGLVKVAPTGEGVEGTVVPCPLGDGGGDGTVFPVGVIEVTTDTTVSSCMEIQVIQSK